jgi:SAM-dependent methyltransferase
MPGYGISTYGDRIAGRYDEWHGSYEQECIDLLAELAGDGPALELGIGTGRIALPLAARGIPVDGIDSSTAMVDRLRDKPGGDAIHVVMGDFSDVPVAGSYRLVFVVFNTFFGLLTQEDQEKCFRNVAGRLAPGGAFLLDLFVPDPARFDSGQTVRALEVGEDEIALEATRHDPSSQLITSQRIMLREGSVALYPVKIRYAWPSEVDLMARLAGLRLRDRWAGWKKERFDTSSTRHISVYERIEGREPGEAPGLL